MTARIDLSTTMSVAHRRLTMQPWKLAANTCCLLLVGLLYTNSTPAQELQIDASEESQQNSPADDDPLGLAAVRDDSFLSGDDFKAYYALLNLAAKTPADELQQQAEKFVQHRREESGLETFVEMIRNPAPFRGKPVVFRGHILQTISFQADENDYGLTRLYEASLFSEDSQTHPVTVVFSEKPDNLPIGGEIVDGVTVYGYFLKTYWYPSSDNRTRKAPLILAKTVHVQPIQLNSNSDPNWPLILGILGGVGVAFLILLIIIQRSDRKRMLEEQKKRLADEVPTFSVQ